MMYAMQKRGRGSTLWQGQECLRRHPEDRSWLRANDSTIIEKMVMRSGAQGS
jgi:hypothetical protein